MDKSGALYGTTTSGGSATGCGIGIGRTEPRPDSGIGTVGCGTVYKLTPPRSGAGPWPETVLHRFAGGIDGARPESTLLIDGKGALFSAGGTAVIEIYGAATGRDYTGPAPVALNLALRLENAAAVDTFYKRLAALGYHALGYRALGVRALPDTGRLLSPQDRPWGHRSFIVHDPDGIPIHIYCELENREG